ncbi:pirin family protein [Corynebacterium guangdongense]|uniref:Redox-sensitive bicupin YhaK (Pirin superfamily) n=1 Tax=Corynebacterium guangdongense TaxID=1783348 RepID=A0ABU1ZYN0_9CORY|nr:pirin family protein [Corynebacterium guangdongense]MDR7330044.1 redox-sensitive bicupin YhaK (pirin superfamily) [Corynebacterium guangdongense]WJZ18602.1 Quercetin 2,3-dioxygenase [Corynebacterium guangdongense]
MSTTEENPPEIQLQPREATCADGARVEIITAREVPLGGPRAMTVYRTLPQKQRSLIGAWCFADHYGPDDVSATGGMDVAVHPHTGLQTVSWLFEGEVTHHDSGNHHAVVLPGEVNFMTAGAGICHSEVSTQATTVLHGVQLWTVLPDHARHGERRFDHYAPALLELDGGQALVFVGSLFGETSPIPTFTPLVGAELRVDAGATLEVELNPGFEHGLLVDAGDVDVEGAVVRPRELAYAGTGETRLRIRNNGPEKARLVLIGGEPFTEDVVMWWNFIGRDHTEIARYREEWENHSERFGVTHGYISHDADGLDRLPAPTLPTSRLRPRTNPEPVARPEMRIDRS